MSRGSSDIPYRKEDREKEVKRREEQDIKKKGKKRLRPRGERKRIQRRKGKD
jgi:hypothetical protein